MDKKKPNQRIKKNKPIDDSEMRISNFKISFQFFDDSQKYASSFRDWQSCGWLSKAIETLQGYCHSSLRSQIDGDKFIVYGSFPPKEKTMFDFPKCVPEDAEWARIHILNKAVVVGHVVGNTFYVVFLDKSHKFWISEKKHT